MHKSLSIFVLAATAFGNSLPVSRVQGEYVEARTADVYTGACFANGEVGLVGELAVFGWRITEGNWQGVKLDGLSVVGVVKASSTLGDRFGNAFPVKSVLIVDERADMVQRVALRTFAQRMSNDLLQDIVRVDYRPISLTFKDDDLHSMVAKLKAGELAEITTRAIHEGDHICSHEEVWYDPLAELDHAMPAVTVAHRFNGKGLNTTWSSPDKRSAFVGTFSYNE